MPIEYDEFVTLISTLICLIVRILFFPLHQVTALHLAAEEGHKHTVQYLVEKEADINIRDDNGVHLNICY